jgi:hypothetical protein
LDDRHPALERREGADRVGQFEVGERAIDHPLLAVSGDTLGLHMTRSEAVLLHHEHEPRRRRLSGGLGGERIEERLQDHGPGAERHALEDSPAVDQVGGQHRMRKGVHASTCLLAWGWW